METPKGGAAKKGVKRSVVFLAVTAEEKGLLGSRYYANRPTVPAKSIVADLNTDMFLPLFPLHSLIVQGLEESDLAGDLRKTARPLGIEVYSDPQPERNAFVRSDRQSAEDFNKVYVARVDGVANSRPRPAGNSASFFKRFAK